MHTIATLLFCFLVPLSYGGERGQIVLVGEKHHSKEKQAAQKKIMKIIKQDKSILVKENVVFRKDDINKTIIGMEDTEIDSLIVIVGSAYFAREAVRISAGFRGKDTEKESKFHFDYMIQIMSLIEFVHKNSYSRTLMKKLCSNPTFSKEIKSVAQVICRDPFSEVDSKLSETQSIIKKVNILNLLGWKPENVFSLFEILIGEIQKDVDRWRRPHYPKKLVRKALSLNSRSKFVELKAVAISLRNHVFIHNLTTIYRYHKNRKNLYVQVGALHLPGMLKGLKARGFPVRSIDTNKGQTL
ncbi:MAG: hypothetical protein HOO06_06830 [Bdellovibrionaceae bacterium]|jgi:hypothetical protein|nr:hypothetical protein [Pseudobdellovibrionaceae bacterium]